MDRQARAWLIPLLWCVVLCVLVGTKASPGFRALMADDSFQYLSVAANIEHGMGLRTSIAHFDEERSWGVLPAPITTFPSGYPAVVAAFTATGLHAQSAALLVTLLASCAAVFLLDFLARHLGLTIFWRALVAGAFVLNCITLEVTTYAMSEPLFTALLTAAFAMLIVSLQRQEAGRPWITIAAVAGLILGVADWVRYAGLFPFVGLLAAGVVALVLARRAAARALLLATVAAAVPIAALMLRNVLLVGSWRGGNNKVVSHSAMEVAHLFAASVRDLVIGNTPWSHMLFARMVLALLVVGGGALGIWTLVRKPLRDRSIPLDELTTGNLLLCVVTATYAASILYVASRTMITLQARIFFPILPLTLLLCGQLAEHADQFACNAVHRRLWRAVTLSAFLFYGVVQIDAYYVDPPQPSYVAAVADLRSTTSEGQDARSLIRQLTGTGGALMATNGQALGYLTGVPTISLVGPEFSERHWDEGYVRDIMRRYSVAALVVSHNDAHFDPADFLGQLGANHFPNWLIVSGITDRVVIYRPVQSL